MRCLVVNQKTNFSLYVDFPISFDRLLVGFKEKSGDMIDYSPDFFVIKQIEIDTRDYLVDLSFEKAIGFIQKILDSSVDERDLKGFVEVLGFNELFNIDSYEFYKDKLLFLDKLFNSLGLYDLMLAGKPITEFLSYEQIINSLISKQKIYICNNNVCVVCKNFW